MVIDRTRKQLGTWFQEGMEWEERGFIAEKIKRGESLNLKILLPFVKFLPYNLGMFGRPRKRPSVKIPASVLRKEAQKQAKKMIQAERKKEATALAREKAKDRARKKITRSKDKQEHWEDFFHTHLRQEIWGAGWIGAAILLVAVFYSEAIFSQNLEGWLRSVFGRGVWMVPLFCAGIGGSVFLKSEMRFPPKRVLALGFFLVAILGLGHLFVPQEVSFAQKELYGGALGFTMTYFSRLYLGDLVTAVGLAMLLWVSFTLSFGVRLSSLFARNEEEASHSKEKRATSVKKEAALSKAAIKEEEEEDFRFKNDLKIVDSSNNKAKKAKSSGKKIELSEEDELTKAKNKSISGQWEPPELDLLKQNHATITVDEELLRDQAEKIRQKLHQFGINVTMKSVHVGPTVTQFTLEPAAGVKLTKITALKNDLALTLAAESLRIEAPIRGKSLVGIEIPNADRAIVGMREILESDAWENETAQLKLAVGRDVAGKPNVVDLAKMPHLLLAGKTGSGKSVAMNVFLTSLLWQNSPETLRLILVDPKRVELSLYNNLPHLLTPVIMEPEKCVSALAWAVAEMNRRYRAFSEVRCRNITEYNEKFPDEKEPYIVIVIDELADLMMVAGKDVEAAFCRIAQMARAVGMHLIIATQRPSVDVVTGLIKANLPARISFKVSSGIDSRTVIDQNGSQDLLGFGDMLYLDGNSGSLSRIQGIYISNEEVERVTNHIKLQFPEMVANDEITTQSIEGMAKGGVLTAGTNGEIADEDLDPYFRKAVDIVMETRKASASFLQRRLEVGYARAARLLDQMEAKGIVGPAKGAKPREIFGEKE